MFPSIVFYLALLQGLNPKPLLTISYYSISIDFNSSALRSSNTHTSAKTLLGRVRLGFPILKLRLSCQTLLQCKNTGSDARRFSLVLGKCFRYFLNTLVPISNSNSQSSSSSSSPSALFSASNCYLSSTVSLF